MKNNYEESYKTLVAKILQEGNSTNTRTGNCKTIFNVSLFVDLRLGFPVITGRQLFWKNIKHEALWIMSGSTNINYLTKNKVYIWNSFADENGELGPTYGAQFIKQWFNVINEIKINPTSRRLIINLWNVDELHKMKLPPCYFSFQFFVIEKFLHVSVSSRSSDVAIGLPYDIPVIGLILTKASELTNLLPGTVTFNICDAHINVENILPALEYLKAPIFNLPQLKNMELINYTHSPKINFTLKA